MGPCGCGPWICPDAGTLADASDDASIDASTGDAAEDAGSSPDAVPSDAAEMDAAEADGGAADAADAGPAPFVLTSAAFAEGGVIPDRHACAAEDLQPALAWSGAPPGTQSFVFVFIDDTIDFVHWVAYDLPASTSMLAEGASDTGQLPVGTREASAFCVEYCGPCPGNPHTYTFRLYALDVATIGFPHSGFFGDAEVSATLDPRSLGVATLTGTYTP